MIAQSAGSVRTGRIYRITSPNIDKVYLGSTFSTIKARFRRHKYEKCTSQIVIQAGESDIELLEEISVIDKHELRYYENLYIEIYKDIAVNIMSAYGENKDKKRERNKLRYEKNKAKISERAKLYREENKAKFSERAKLYKEKYKAKNIERAKLYKEKNKQVITCLCGGSHVKYGKSQHEKSKRHKKYIASNKHE